MATGSEYKKIIQLHQTDMDCLDFDEYDDSDSVYEIPRDLMGYTAYDYLEMAEEAASPASSCRYAKKALELDPDMVSAKFILELHKAKSPQELQPALERMIAEEVQHLSKQGIQVEKANGELGLLSEARPYMRINMSYLETLMLQGKYRKAIELGEKMCQLDNGDHLGVRYQLMALYAVLEDIDEAEGFLEMYPEDTPFMLLPLIALSYKLEEADMAAKYIQRLCSQTTGIKQAISILKKLSPEIVEEMEEMSYYQPFSKDEVILAYLNAPYLYGQIPGFLKWLEQQIPKKTTSKGKRKYTKEK